jgi:hypothetical protein
MAVARLATVRPVEPVSALLGRLEDLERRVRAAAPPSGVARPTPRPSRSAPREARIPPTPAPPPRTPAKAKQEEPPPLDDPEGCGSSGPNPMERWNRLVPQLKKLGPAAVRLADGRPTLRGSVLVITLPAGRAQAEGRRARGTPEIEGLIRREFPKVATIQVEPEAGTGTPLDHQRSLTQQVLDDPDCRRIMAKLGAEIESVTELAPPSDEP